MITAALACLLCLGGSAGPVESKDYQPKLIVPQIQDNAQDLRDVRPPFPPGVS